jgi:arginyl-tRNA synthetase
MAKSDPDKPLRSDLMQALKIIEEGPDPDLEVLEEEAKDAQEKLDDYLQANSKYQQLKSDADKTREVLNEYKFGETSPRKSYKKALRSRLDKIRQRLYAEGVNDKTLKLVRDAVEEFQSRKD